MTNDRTNWETLVSKAREDSAPTLDVTLQVTEKIAWTNTLPMSSGTLSAGPTWSAAVASIAAALMMMLTASLSGVSWDDPLGDWFSSMFMVMS